MEGFEWGSAAHFGIIVRIFAEAGGQHHIAHFHAYWQDQVAVVSIEPIDVIAGSLPQQGRLPKPIESLAKPPMHHPIYRVESAHEAAFRELAQRWELAAR